MLFWKLGMVFSKFDTCLHGNLQVEILIKSLEMGQQRYDSLVFATGPGSWNLTCAVSLPVSFKSVAKLRRLISLPTTLQFAVIAKLRRLVSESTTIQFNIFGWDSVSDNRACHVFFDWASCGCREVETIVALSR